jgi:hypothetical protein
VEEKPSSSGSDLQIISVNVARPKVLLRWPVGDVISAIGKQPVNTDELELTILSPGGDEQADTRTTPSGLQVHGGVHQAVYAFPAAHYPRLEGLLGCSLGWGFMGENLTVRGATEDDVGVGDAWRCGSAWLQVSAPRGPVLQARHSHGTPSVTYGRAGGMPRRLVPASARTWSCPVGGHDQPRGTTCRRGHGRFRSKPRSTTAPTPSPTSQPSLPAHRI